MAGPLGLGLIGCGDFGQFCLNVYRGMRGIRIAAIADVSKGIVDRLSKQLGVPGHHNPAELVSRDDVDLVHIATPPNSHRGLVIAAARAGKHVLCEKPLALTVTDANEMLDAVEFAGVIAPVNFVLRYNRVTEAVKQILDSGVLGKVLSARLTNCATDYKLPPKHWFWHRKVSGGIFVEHGVHFFDLYRHWLGDGVVLHAHGETRGRTHMEDRVTCTVRHDSGAVASHYHGFDQVRPLDRTDHRLVCELGDIRVEGWIPLMLTVDAAVNAKGVQTMASCCPGAEIEVLGRLGKEIGALKGRGRVRKVDKRVWLSWTPEPRKDRAYARGVRDLLADQVAHIRDRSHERRITEENGRIATVLADTAMKMAAVGSS